MSIYEKNIPNWSEKHPDKGSMTPEGRAAVRQHAGFTGQIVESRNWWRWTCLSTFPVIAVLGISNAWLAVNKPAVEVFGVMHDPDGRIQDVARGGNFVADGKIVAHRLLQWVKQVRSVSPDRTLMDAGQQEALAMMTSRGQQMIGGLYEMEDPGVKLLEWPEEKARLVDDVEVIEESPNTYTVAWRETVWLNDRAISTQRFRGTIVVKRIGYGENPEAFIKNPIGAFVDTVSWQVAGVEK